MDKQVNGVTFTIGSHMYGLNTENSDTDTMTVWFTPDEYLRVFKEEKPRNEKDNNNIKEYSLAAFLQLCAKGNPNTVEILNLLDELPAAENDNQRFVLAGLREMREFYQYRGAPFGLVSAYRGHMLGMENELAAKGVTPKRLSHAIRVAYSALYTMETKKVPDFRKSVHREEVLALKSKEKVEEEDVLLFATLYRRVVDMYEKENAEDYVHPKLCQFLVNTVFTMGFSFNGSV